MVINFAAIVVIGIVLFGLAGLIRGVRSVALTTGAIFFGIVVVLFSGELVIGIFRRLGVPFTGIDTQALFLAALFIFTFVMAAIVLGRIVALSGEDIGSREKWWGFALGLLNGFIAMAVIEHYVAIAAQADVPSGSPVAVGIPSLVFDHPNGNTWSVTLHSTSFMLFPPGPNTDLWGKLPTALLLLLLFLGFVFVGTVYTRLSRSRS